MDDHEWVLVGACDCRVLVEAVWRQMDRRVLSADVDADVGLITCIGGPAGHSAILSSEGSCTSVCSDSS